MKPYHQDPSSGLWLPEGYGSFDCVPGYSQLKSGLWVPDSLAPTGWLNATTTVSQPAEWTAEKQVESAEKVQAKFGVDWGQAEPISLEQAKVVQAKLDADMEAGYLKMMYELMSPVLFSGPHTSKSPFPASPFSAGLGNALGLMSPGPARDVATECSERAGLELALADFIPDKPTRQRLAELLWLGTEVCCLNLRRRNEKWRMEMAGEEWIPRTMGTIEVKP